MLRPLPTLPLLLILCAALALPSCGGGGDTQSFATCGNDHIDVGERCDDGNIDDHDDCTSACQPARCGDGVAYRSVEECDGRDMLSVTCANFGQIGPIACAADCRFDLSACVAPPPTSTPSPTAPPTASPTPSPTPRTVTCGDGLLSLEETCALCPADCTPQACDPSSERAPVTVSLTLPNGATQVVFSVAYRTSVVALPAPLSGRVTSLTTPTRPLRPTNTGYRVDVMTQSDGQSFSGPFAAISFDHCSGASAPEVDDFACQVTTCRSGGTDVSGCSCTAAP